MTTNRVGVNLRASAYLHQGDRKYMEDEFQVAYQKSPDNKNIEHAFFGIFDGHGGKDAAHFAKDNLMDNIVSQRAFWSDNDEDVLNAIREGFLQTHHAMWKVIDQWPRTGSGWPSTSGTTASIAFIRRQKLYIGHVGDSGIVLGFEDNCGNWRGESLTRDHKPESALEMTRIQESGGKVVYKSGVPRVVWNRPKSGHQGPVRRSTPMDEIPFLAVARSLGDLWSYNPKNDEFIVSPEPDVCVIDIDITHHRCLIFGTDGLWNALSPQSAVSIAYYTEKNNEKHHLGIKLPCGKERLWINPSRSIVSGALERYQRILLRADNTSAVTVFLDPPGRPKREVLLQQVATKHGTTANSSTSPRDTNKQASVQVNFYNKDSGSAERGSTMRVQERLPEDWQTKDNTTILAGSKLESPNENSPTTPSNENMPTSSMKTERGSPSCSACGYSMDENTENSQPGTPLDSHNRSICLPTKSDTLGSTGKQPDIQIPVVSSSTGAVKFRAESGLTRLQDSSPDLFTKRRTRSCIPPKNENSKFNKHSLGTLWRPSATHSLTNIKDKLDSTFPSNGYNSSVLKSVNRDSNQDFSPSLEAGLHGAKRKRQSGSPVDRESKLLRVHTRARTLSAKSMITRSQEKMLKSKYK